MSLRRVRPGEDLKIPANAYNLFCEAAEDYLRRKSGNLAGGGGLGAFSPTLTIPIRNTTGSHIEPYSAAKLLASPLTIENYVSAVAGRPVVDVAKATSMKDEPLAIPTQGIPDGAVGQAVICGVTPLICYVTDTTHRFAVPNPDTGYWKSARVGPLFLLQHSLTGPEEYSLAAILPRFSGEIKHYVKITGPPVDYLYPGVLLESVNTIRYETDQVRVQRIPMAGASPVVFEKDAVYDVALIGSVEVSGTIYPLYDGTGSDNAWTLDCDDGVDGYYYESHLHPWVRGEFVTGTPPTDGPLGPYEAP